MTKSCDGELTPGSTFHGLRVHSKLGEGAMGAAFLASHSILRHPVVIKTFKVQGSHDLFKEAHLAARVNSPHVVGVLDAGVDQGVSFVVQRYVDGIDLDELVERWSALGRTLSVPTVARILGDAAEGLHAIHQAGVVHRDIKPANIFLRGDGAVAVGDFGIALDTRLRRDHVAGEGTPYFMAPEQWTDAKVDRRADVYALGITGHLLLTGEYPFDAVTMSGLRKAHLRKAYEPPRAAGPGAAYLFGVVERLLCKDPRDRYRTAGELAQVLQVVREPMAKVRSTGKNEGVVGSITVVIRQADLAEVEADVVVNAANPWLEMDAGVAAALKEKAGGGPERVARRSAPANMGDVVWTGAGRLHAKHMAHAVAALEGAICVQRCTLRVLLESEARSAKRVAFPALGTGVGEVPMELSAKLMLEAIQTFANLEPSYVRTIELVLRTSPACKRFADVMHSM